MIKIKVDELNDELKRLRSSIDVFKPYSDSFSKNTSAKFTGFNSDFISELNDVLEGMSDTKAPKLVEKAENLYTITKQMVDGFDTLDNEMAKKMKE